MEEAYFQVKRYSKRFSSDHVEEAFFSRIKILKILWPDDLEYSFIQEKWYRKSYDLMAWKKLLFKRIDTKILWFVHMFILGGTYVQEER